MAEKVDSLGIHFDRSYEFILNDENYFFDFFYTRFFNSSNLIKNAFAFTDMNRQKKMLKDSINHLIEFFRTNEESDYLKFVARHHANKVRVDPYMYKLFIDSFIQALEDTYPDYCEETALSWRCILKPGIEYMCSFRS